MAQGLSEWNDCRRLSLCDRKDFCREPQRDEIVGKPIRTVRCRGLLNEEDRVEVRRAIDFREQGVG